MKKNIIIIATIVVIVLCATCLAACTQYATLYSGNNVAYKRSEGDFIKTDVTLSDLSDEYKAKLLAFDHIKEENWFSDTVLRYVMNTTDDVNRDEEFDSDLNAFDDFPYTLRKRIIKTFISHTQSSPDATPANNLGAAQGYASIDKNAVKLFNSSGELRKGEMVVGKWKYFAAYVDAYDIKLSLSDIERIIDGKDCFAKYWILRNCSNATYGYKNDALDVACLYYYGIIPRDLNEKIPVKITAFAFAENGCDTFTIAGYYENEYEAEGMALLDTEMDLATARTIGINSSEKFFEEPFRTYNTTLLRAFNNVGPAYFNDANIATE